MTAAPPDLDFVWARLKFFFRSMIVIEAVIPALLIAAGVIALLAGQDTTARSFGLAVLLPGVALAVGAVIRIVGLDGARRAFLGAERQALLRRGRRLALISLGVGVFAAIISLFIISMIGWLDGAAGFIAILIVFFVIVLTLMFSLVEFTAEGTAAKATKDFA